MILHKTHILSITDPWLVNMRNLIIDSDLSWCGPHITIEPETNDICMEWWSSHKKLTIYKSTDKISFIKSWGVNTTSQMESGEIDGIFTGDRILQLWVWLWDLD